MKKTKLLLWIISMVSISLHISINVNAAEEISEYDFNMYEVNSIPDGISILTGNGIIIEEKSGNHALQFQGYGGSYNIDSFIESDRQQLTWATSWSNSAPRSSFTLRTQKNDNSTNDYGYVFQVNPGGNRNNIAIHRSTEQGFVNIGQAELLQKDPNTTTYFRATAIGNELTFEQSINGVDWDKSISVKDNIYHKGGIQYLEGYSAGVQKGFATTNISYSTLGNEDRINVNTPSSYQVIQRDISTNVADIEIKGTYFGNPEKIEARYNSMDEFTVIDANPKNGEFTGVLKDQKIGQGDLEIRFSNDFSIETTKKYVGIGDIFVIAGQSNASGRGYSNQSYNSPDSGIKASMFGNNDVWQELSDPVDSHIGQIDGISIDSQPQKGSPYPLIATKILESQNVPVAFLPTAKGGSSIEEWTSDEQSASNPKKLYGSMKRRIDEVGKIRAVLWYQGESDIGKTTIDYSEKMQELFTSIYNDFGVPTIVAQVSYTKLTSFINKDDVDKLRQQQWDIAENNDYVFHGPLLYDLDLTTGDSVHIKTNNDIQLLANRWWDSIDKEIYNEGELHFPQILEDSPIYSNKTNELEFSFDTKISSTVPNKDAFTVFSNDNELTIENIKYDDKTGIFTLKLENEDILNTVSLSYASANDAVNNAVIDENEELLAVPFYKKEAKINENEDLSYLSLKKDATYYIGDEFDILDFVDIIRDSEGNDIKNNPSLYEVITDIDTTSPNTTSTLTVNYNDLSETIHIQVKKNQASLIIDDINIYQFSEFIPSYKDVKKATDKDGNNIDLETLVIPSFDTLTTDIIGEYEVLYNSPYASKSIKVNVIKQISGDVNSDGKLSYTDVLMMYDYVELKVLPENVSEKSFLGAVNIFDDNIFGFENIEYFISMLY